MFVPVTFTPYNHSVASSLFHALLPFHLFTHLALTLSHNQLSSLPEDLSALLHLQQFNLSSNLFETFPPVLRLMPALTTVDLSHNRLADVHAEDFSGVQSLEMVDLRGNPLTQAVKTLLLSMVRVRVVVEEEKEEN